jgi:microcin C transport system permease protein
MASRLDEKNTAPAPAKAAGPANSRHTQSGFMAAVSVLKSAYTKLTRFDLSPINRRRLDNFRSSKRGLWSLRLFLTLFALSLCSELIANDRPLMVRYKGELLFPALKDYPESTFGGFLPNTSYRDPTIQDEILTNGWMLWAPVRYDYNTILNELPQPAPSPPSWWLTKEKRCGAYKDGVENVNCTAWNWNWLGTDDQGRDVVARMLYGMRVSVLFGLLLTIFSAIIGVTAGAVQGFYGGKVDLIFQRFLEIWSSMPHLYVLIIIASVLVPGFWTLLGVLLLFHWVSLVGVVRAEFLRGRNFEYITAARALGLSDSKIMFKHLLPNAMVATLTFLPFMMSGSITSLTALDYLGLGMPPGSPSLGELLYQGKSNVQAPWLGLTAFFSMAFLLSLLIFVGEAVRDALDPRKTFRSQAAPPVLENPEAKGSLVAPGGS